MYGSAFMTSYYSSENCRYCVNFKGCYSALLDRISFSVSQPSVLKLGALYAAIYLKLLGTSIIIQKSGDICHLHITIPCSLTSF